MRGACVGLLGIFGILGIDDKIELTLLFEGDIELVALAYNLFTLFPLPLHCSRGYKSLE